MNANRLTLVMAAAAAGLVALGGTALAIGVGDPVSSPATPTPTVRVEHAQPVVRASVPTTTRSYDGTAHDATDDHGGGGHVGDDRTSGHHGADDPAGHDVGDDHGDR